MRRSRLTMLRWVQSNRK